MKNAIAIVLAAVICFVGGCSQSTDGRAVEPEREPARDSATDALTLKPGFEWKTVLLKLSSSSGKISAACVNGETLWFVSAGTLYSANVDGSNVEVHIAEVPPTFDDLAVDLDGNAYFGDSGGTQIQAVAPDGTPIALIEVSSGEIPVDVFTLSDGTPAALIWSNSQYVVKAINGDSLSTVFQFPAAEDFSISGICAFGEKYLTTDGTGIYACSDSEISTVLKWTDAGVASGVLGNNIDLVGVIGSKILYLNNKNGRLIFVQPSEVERERVELVLGITSGWISPELQNAIAEFNASNKDYKVVTKHYPSIERFNVQIIAGEIPDMLDVNSSLSVTTYAQKGLFEDLNLYFERDPEVALVPTIRRILQTGDQLFRVAPGFMVMTLAGNSDFVGTEQGWTFDEMKQRLADAPDGAVVTDPSWPREWHMILLLYQNINDFVDWESGTALFDSPDFKSVLEFIKTIPEENTFGLDPHKMVMEGKQLVVQVANPSIEAFVIADNRYDGKTVYKGFPSVRKTSATLRPEPYSLAMTAASSHKDAVWSFIRTALLIDPNTQTIPTVQAKFDAAVAVAMTEPRYDVAPMTELQLQKLMTFLDGIDSALSSNPILERIIEEETPAFFAGDKSLDETCRVIQSRAQLYVGEQH